MQMIRTYALAGVVLLGGAAPGAAQSATDSRQVCTIAAASRAIPEEVRETSGLALGRVNPDVLWTHNDSGNEAELFALGADGALRVRIPLANVKLSDWEDIAASTCGDTSCLYLADIGDNVGRRARVTIHEMVEPALSAQSATIVRSIVARYPDGPQDAEALFRLPNGDFYIITKGRQQSIKLYRLMVAEDQGEASLQLVRELLPRPKNERDRVTGATASPDGNWVAFRTYATLYLYRTADLLGSGEPYLTYSLAPLAEKQGESVALSNDGTIWLTSEAEQKKDRPTIAGLKCTLN
jgi:hypothetical protein